VAAAARVDSFAAVPWRDGINGKMTVEKVLSMATA
jgi:hypothetical protein